MDGTVEHFQWFWVVVSYALKIGVGMVSLEILLWGLRRIDHRGGLNWSGVIYPSIFADSRATAQYFGARIIAVSILVGQAISG